MTHFHSAVMDPMNVEAVSNDPEVRQAFPDCIKQTFGLPVVCWKCSTPLGIVLSNEKGAVLNAHKESVKACGCHKVPDRFKDASEHVVTTDSRVVEHDGLRKRMQAGTTLRSDYEQSEFVDTSAAESEGIQTLQASIEHHIKTCCEINEIPPYLFSEWQGILLEKLRKYMMAWQGRCRVRQQQHHWSRVIATSA